MQSAHDRGQIIIWLGSLCILYCLTRPWIAYWATQRTYNISWAIWRSWAPENPLCVQQRSTPYRRQSVPKGTILSPKEPECSRRNQRVSPKEPYHIFGRWPATPYSPILVRQYKYTTCSCLMQNWITDTYLQILYPHISQKHRILTLQVWRYLPCVWQQR